MTSVAQVRKPGPVRVMVLWNREPPEPAGVHIHEPVVAQPAAAGPGPEHAASAPPQAQPAAAEQDTAPATSAPPPAAEHAASAPPHAQPAAAKPDTAPATSAPPQTPLAGAPAARPAGPPAVSIEPPAVREVLAALRAHGYVAFEVNAEEDIERITAAVVVERPSIVFSLVDEIYGDTTHIATIAAYLDLLGVPFVGADHLCLATCPDRVRAHILLADAGVPVPGFRTVRDINAVPALDGLRTPVIVTQAFDDVYEYEGDERPLFEWQEVVDRVATLTTEYELPFLVEEYLAERRVHALVLGNHNLEVLPLLEAADEEETSEDGETPAPWVLAQLDYDTADRIRELARRAFRALGCRDLARIDFHLDEDERPHVVDVRALVDFGPQGPLFTAAESTERGFAGVVAEVVRLACARAHVGEASHAQPASPPEPAADAAPAGDATHDETRERHREQDGAGEPEDGAGEPEDGAGEPEDGAAR